MFQSPKNAYQSSFFNPNDGNYAFIKSLCLRQIKNNKSMNFLINIKIKNKFLKIM